MGSSRGRALPVPVYSLHSGRRMSGEVFPANCTRGVILQYHLHVWAAAQQQS